MILYVIIGCHCTIESVYNLIRRLTEIDFRKLIATPTVKHVRHSDYCFTTTFNASLHLAMVQ